MATLPPVTPITIETPPAGEDGNPPAPSTVGSPYDDLIFGEMQDRFEDNLATYLRNVKAGDTFNNARNLASTLGQATGSIG